MVKIVDIILDNGYLNNKVILECPNNIYKKAKKGMCGEVPGKKGDYTVVDYNINNIKVIHINR